MSFLATSKQHSDGDSKISGGKPNRSHHSFPWGLRSSPQWRQQSVHKMQGLWNIGFRCRRCLKVEGIGLHLMKWYTTIIAYLYSLLLSRRKRARVLLTSGSIQLKTCVSHSQRVWTNIFSFTCHCPHVLDLYVLSYTGKSFTLSVASYHLRDMLAKKGGFGAHNYGLMSNWKIIGQIASRLFIVCDATQK